MSSKTLRQCMLRANKNGSCGPTLASPLRASLTLSLISASSPSMLNRCGASHLQIRPFCHTPVRRLFISDPVVAGCLGVAGGIMLAYYLPKLISITIFRPRSIPPMTWISAADRKTREDVVSMVSTAFEMARRSPIRRRDQAMREATFHVPHEVARFNSGAAPHFVLEDMGPMPPLPKDCEADIPTKLKHPWNIEREARAFLYFPHRSARATAAFVAINAELQVTSNGQLGDVMHKVHRASEDQNSLLVFGLNSWLHRYRIWADRQPDIIDRIKPGPLPVIFCFRGKATSCLFDPKKRIGFGDQAALLGILSLDEYSK